MGRCIWSSCACLDTMLLPQCWAPNFTEGADSRRLSRAISVHRCVEIKECPIDGITNDGQVWRKSARKQDLTYDCNFQTSFLSQNFDDPISYSSAELFMTGSHIPQRNFWRCILRQHFAADCGIKTILLQTTSFTRSLCPSNIHSTHRSDGRMRKSPHTSLTKQNKTWRPNALANSHSDYGYDFNYFTFSHPSINLKIIYTQLAFSHPVNHFG